jgi:hypothetical protein
MNREFFNFMRNPKAFRMKVIRTIVTCVLLCCVYARLGTDKESIGNRYGLVMFFTLGMGFNGIGANLLPFMINKPVFKRETATKMYGVTPYFLANNVVTMPFDIVDGMITGVVVYWIVGMNGNSENFWKAMVGILLIILSGGALGILLGNVSPNLQAAVALQPLALLPNTMCTGLLVNYDKIPDWFFFKWTSPFRYAFEGLVRNEFDDLDGFSHHTEHKAVHALNLEFSFWEDMWILAIITILFRFLGFVAINLLNRRK